MQLTNQEKVNPDTSSVKSIESIVSDDGVANTVAKVDVITDDAETIISDDANTNVTNIADDTSDVVNVANIADDTSDVANDTSDVADVTSDVTDNVSNANVTSDVTDVASDVTDNGSLVKVTSDVTNVTSNVTNNGSLANVTSDVTDNVSNANVTSDVTDVTSDVTNNGSLANDSNTNVAQAMDRNIRKSSTMPPEFGMLTTAGILLYLYSVSMLVTKIFDLHRHRQQWYRYDPYVGVRLVLQMILLAMGFSHMRTFCSSVSVCHKSNVAFKISKLFICCIVFIIVEHMYRYSSYMTFNPKHFYLKQSSCIHGNIDGQGCRMTNCAYVDKSNPKHIYYLDVMGSVCPNTVHYINDSRMLIKDKYREEFHVASIRIAILLALMFTLYM